MIERSVTHAMFVLERTYDATPERVFNAFADPAAKARWFVGPEDWDQGEVSLDFRVGGREINVGGPKGGPTSYYEARYQDIVPNQRIVSTYEMRLDDVRVSVSLATIELGAVQGGTRLTITEHGAYLDGHEDPTLREEGTRMLLDALGAALEREPATA